MEKGAHRCATLLARSYAWQCATVLLGRKTFESPCRAAAKHSGRRFYWHKCTMMLGFGDYSSLLYLLKGHFYSIKMSFQMHACLWALHGESCLLPLFCYIPITL